MAEVAVSVVGVAIVTPHVLQLALIGIDVAKAVAVSVRATPHVVALAIIRSAITASLTVRSAIATHGGGIVLVVPGKKV